MELFLYLFYFVYVAMALTPLLIIFILNNEIQFIYKGIIFDNIRITIGIFIFSLLVSWFYIFLSKKNNKNKNSETMECIEVEIAEPKYIPIYIAYFVIALSIKHNWLIFCIVFIMIYLLIIKGKFSYFNPYLLFLGYHFYEVQIENSSNENAKYKLFLISNKKIKNIKNHDNLIRLNDFTYLDKGVKNGK